MKFGYLSASCHVSEQRFHEEAHFPVLGYLFFFFFFYFAIKTDRSVSALYGSLYVTLCFVLRRFDFGVLTFYFRILSFLF